VLLPLDAGGASLALDAANQQVHLLENMTRAEATRSAAALGSDLPVPPTNFVAVSWIMPFIDIAIGVFKGLLSGLIKMFAGMFGNAFSWLMRSGMGLYIDRCMTTNVPIQLVKDIAPPTAKDTPWSMAHYVVGAVPPLVSKHSHVYTVKGVTLGVTKPITTMVTRSLANLINRIVTHVTVRDLTTR
jgi:hypothetical protein